MSWKEDVVEEVEGWEYVAPYAHLITPEHIASIEAQHPDNFVDEEGCPNYVEEIVAPAREEIINGFPLLEVMYEVYDYQPGEYFRDNQHEGMNYFIHSALLEAVALFCTAYMAQKS